MDKVKDRDKDKDRDKGRGRGKKTAPAPARKKGPHRYAGLEDKTASLDDNGRRGYYNNARAQENRVGAGVSLMADHREDTISAKELSDRVYLASWEQLPEVKKLLAHHCPKAEVPWDPKSQRSIDT